MIAIRNIASYVPAGYQDNLEKLDEFGFGRDFLENKIGVMRAPRMAGGEDTSDMCVSAFEALLKRADINIGDVDFISVCTQNPDGHGMPQTSAIVHGKLGARNACAAFDISLACSGFVYSLSAATSFMEANGLAKGLLFTADPYSKILDAKDRNTSLLFGDAATVTLLSAPAAGETAWIPRRYRFSTYSEHADRVHNKTGLFSMDGQAVVMFAMRVLPGEVDALLSECGLAPDDVDLFVFHQGSKFIVESVARRMGLPDEKVPVHLAHVGNTVSSSIPLVLEQRLENPDVNRVLCNGFGVGLSVGSCILERYPASRDHLTEMILRRG